MAKPLPLSRLFIKGKPRENQPSSSVEDLQTEGNETEIETIRKPQPLRTILIPPVIIATINLAALALTDRLYIASEALFLSTPIEDGGLGLSVSAIGTFSSTAGILVGISQVLFFAPLHAKLGSKYLFILGLSAAIPRFVLWPVANWIARTDGYTGLIWFGLGLQMCCSAFIQFAYGKSSYVPFVL